MLTRELGLGALPKLVAIAIAEQASDGDGGAWPSIETIAARVEHSRRPVQRALASLESAGELVRVLGGAGPGDSTLYVLTLGRTGAELEKAVACARARRGDLRAAVATPLTDQPDRERASPAAPEGRRRRHRKSVASGTGRAAVATPQPSMNQNGTLSEPQAAPAATAAPAGSVSLQEITYLQAELIDLGVSRKTVGPIADSLARLPKAERAELLRNASRAHNPAGWIVSQVRRLDYQRPA